MKQTILVAALGVLLAPISNLRAGELSEKGIADSIEPPADSIWTRDKLTGDWGGLRSSLADKGIYVDLRLAQVYQGVASGGINTGSEYGGALDYIVNIDAHKLGLWKGLAFNIHATTRFGNDIGSKAGGLTLPAAPLLYPLPGDYSGTEIPGIAVYQTFFDGKAQAFFGKLHAIDLVQGLLPQTTGNGVETFMNVNALATALPWFRFVTLSQWGGGAWTVKDGMPQAGVIAFGPYNVSDNWDWDPAWEDGVSILGFYRHSYKIDDKDGYLMGIVGGSTREYKSLDPTDWGLLRGTGLVDSETENPVDVAAYLYQVLWEEGKSNVHLLAGGTVGTDNPQFSDWTTFASLGATGLLRGRPNDKMGISGWFNSMSGDLKSLTSTVGIEVQDLWGMEVFYNYEITPSIHLTADLQLLQNTNPDDDLAIVPGLRMVIDF